MPAALAARSQVEWTGPADQFNVWGKKGRDFLTWGIALPLWGDGARRVGWEQSDN